MQCSFFSPQEQFREGWAYENTLKLTRQVVHPILEGGMCLLRELAHLALGQKCLLFELVAQLLPAGISSCWLWCTSQATCTRSVAVLHPFLTFAAASAMARSR